MISLFVERPITLLMICVSVVILGATSAIRMPLRLLPEHQATEFEIKTAYSGASAVEVETAVSSPLERILSTAPGLKAIESRSERGRSTIHIRFRPGLNQIDILGDLKEKVEGFTPPEGSSRPKVETKNSGGRSFMTFAFALRPGESSIELAGRLRAGLLKRIDGIDGIASSEIIGASRNEVKIEVNPIIARSLDVSFPQIFSALESAGKEHQLGSVELAGKMFSLRVGGKLQSIEALRGVIVKTTEKRAIRLDDIAKVSQVEAEPAVRPRLNGRPALVIEVRREAEANAVVLSEKVGRELAAVLNDDGLSFEILFDEGIQVASALNGVSDAVISGAVLSGLVLFLLLQSVWSSFVISVITPLSLCLTLVLMYLAGMDFNVMSLAGLALGVGMLMDNATVVLESIEAERLLIPDAKESAILGAKKVVGAVGGSTVSQIVVFGPLVFVDGPIGRLFRDLALSISISLFSSLLLSLAVIPTLCAYSKFKLPKRRQRVGPINRVLIFRALGMEGVHSIGARFYLAFTAISFSLSTFLEELAVRSMPIRKNFQAALSALLRRISMAVLLIEEKVKESLPRVLKKPSDIFKITALLTLGGLAVFWFKGTELFPDESLARLEYVLEFDPKQPISVTSEATARAEKEILSLPTVRSVSSRVGASGSNKASLTVLVADGQAPAAIKGVSAVLKRVPDLRFRRDEDGKGKPVELIVLHQDLTVLHKTVERIIKEAEGIAGLADVESDFMLMVPELQIDFNPLKLAAHGLTVDSFLSDLKPIVTGLDTGTLQLKGNSYATKLVSEPEFLNSFSKLKAFSVGEARSRIFLSSVANVEERESFGSIRHLGRKRTALVRANIDGIDLGTANKRVLEVARPIALQAGAELRLGGQAEERAKSNAGLAWAFLISLFAIYLILAGQFESFLQPIVVLAAVPLCISGVAGFLLLFGLKVSVMVYVSFVLLIGVSINTSILMVDCANQLMMEGKDASTAILESTLKRIKPILVTSACNLIGLVPIAFSLDPGMAMQRPLAISILGGQFSSLVLTILLIPAIYVMAMERARA